MKKTEIKRGDIYMVTLETKEGSHVIRGGRPVIIVSNNMVNYHSPVINVIPLTTQKKRPLPIHVELSGFGLTKDSTAIVEQVLTIDKSSLVRKIGSLAGSDKMQEIALALKRQLDVA